MPDKKMNDNNTEEQARGRKLFLIDGVMASSEANTFMGNLLTAFALALGATDSQIGGLTTARNIGGFAQLITNYLLQRLGSKKHLFYWTFSVSRTIKAIIAFLPIVPLAFISQNSVWWLIGLMLIVSSGDSITLVLKKTWLLS